MTKPVNKLDDPRVKAAIRLLQVKGVPLDDIRKAYQYYDKLRRKAVKE